jgi:hypothetical protein
MKFEDSVWLWQMSKTVGFPQVGVGGHKEGIRACCSAKRGVLVMKRQEMTPFGGEVVCVSLVRFYVVVKKIAKGSDCSKNSEHIETPVP